MTSKKKENPKEFEGYKFKGTGLTTAEKHWAKSQFDEYRNHYHLDHLSDLKLLEELVYREAFQERYKKKIATLVKKLKETSKKSQEILSEDEIVPKYVLNALNTNLEQIILLKEKLGLFKEKNVDDPFEKFKILEGKFDIWKEDHIEERKVTCPFCSQIFFLNVRTKAYTASKLKLYKNKVLCNEHLWQCYRENRITKIDMALILNVSENYIDWLQERIYNKDDEGKNNA